MRGLGKGGEGVKSMCQDQIKSSNSRRLQARLPWGTSVRARRTVVAKLRTARAHNEEREQTNDRTVERVGPVKPRSKMERRGHPR